MFTKTLLTLTAIILVFSACQLQATVIPSTWVGGAGRNWEDAINWNPPIVPDNSATNTFAVTIDAGTGEVSVILAYGHVIDSIRCYGDVTFHASMQYAPVKLSLSDPSGLTNYNEVHTSALGMRLIDIGGNVNNTPGADIDFWGATVEGDLVNPTGGKVEINGSVSAGNVTNDGDVLIADKFSVHGKLTNSGRIGLYNCGYDCEAFDNTVDGQVTGCGVSYCHSSWTNNGRILATGGSLCLALATAFGSMSNRGILTNDPLAVMSIKHLGSGLQPDANNLGTIEVNAGGGVAFDCNLVNEPNGVIKLLGGTLAAKTITQKSGATFQGFGGITGNVVIDPNAIIKLSGPTNIVGDLAIGEGATLEIEDGIVLVTGDLICSGGIIQTLNGTIIIKGETKDGICSRIFVD